MGETFVNCHGKYGPPEDAENNDKKELKNIPVSNDKKDDADSTNDGGLTTTIIIIIAVVASLIVCISIALFFYCHSRR